ncbi:MAG: hypothetical protein J7642_22130 [Cyanobacteria bacterium SBC]|nr:hypothetical protein [Cyanobacteria bacterium SBC]
MKQIVKKPVRIAIVPICMALWVGIFPNVTRALEVVVAQQVRSSLSSWEAFTSEGGQFNVQIPRQPEARARTTTVLGKPIDWNVFRADEGSETYAVVYTDLTDAITEGGSKSFLASIVNDLLAEAELENLAERSQRISFSGYPGREFLGVSNGQIVAIRLYLIEDRLYGLFARTDELSHATWFLESFQARPLWPVVTSVSGNFSVAFPVDYQEETDTIELNGEQLNWTLYKARDTFHLDDRDRTSDDGNLYVVGYTDLPENFTTPSIETSLTKVGNELLDRVNLQPLQEHGRSISLDNYPGREYIGIVSSRSIALRLYVVDRRLYALISVADDVESVSRFLNSFTLQ